MHDPTLPTLTYLTFDSLREGVGASQIVPYVERLSRRGVDIIVHSFEKQDVEPATRDRLLSAGAHWVAHRFGPYGPLGGALRVAQGARLVHRADLVHARSHLPAASALAARVDRWIWDVRSFWVDERIAVGSLRRGSPEERLLRRVERDAARHSSGIVTLTRAAVDALAERFGSSVAEKAEVVPTCADLDRFPPAPMPDTGVLRLLFSGTLNAMYDLPAMVHFAERLRRRRPTELHVLTPGPTPWDDRLAAAGVTRTSAAPGRVAPHLAASHVGLSVCRFDAGLALRAAVPTKIAEFLATGRPVVVNRGLGDFDNLLPRLGCGVVLADASKESLEEAAERVDELVQDPSTTSRCRALAEQHFSLDRGVERLLALYRRAVA